MGALRGTRRRRIAPGSLAGWFILLSGLLTGCGEDTMGPETADEIAVFGYLYVNETVSLDNPIYVTRNMPIGELYDPEEAAVDDALVTLWEEGGSRIDTLALVGHGHYANPAIRVGSRRTYHLRVEIEGRQAITAATTTPDSFTVLRGPLPYPEQMVHSSIADSFPIVLSCENPEQIFLTDVYCMENWEDARYVIRFGDHDRPDDFEEYGGANGEPRHIFAYFRLKDIERDGSIYTITWYGDMMAFYGQQRVGIFSIDDNYYNYIYRDHPELNGGIAGGIGVFGSACKRQYFVEAVE